MRADEVNSVVLLDSPEESPATSCAAVSSSSPVCLAVAWVPLSVADAEAGASLGRASACVVGRRVLRAGPAVELGFLIRFVLFFSQICVYIQKYVSPSW